MSRLTIDITDQQHRDLKAFAALQGKTIKQFVLERLLPADDKADEDWEKFKDFINQRIESGLAGNVSDRTFDEIIDAAFERKNAA